jgi:hypothetical protein
MTVTPTQLRALFRELASKVEHAVNQHNPAVRRSDQRLEFNRDPAGAVLIRLRVFPSLYLHVWEDAERQLIKYAYTRLQSKDDVPRSNEGQFEVVQVAGGQLMLVTSGRKISIERACRLLLGEFGVAVSFKMFNMPGNDNVLLVITETPDNARFRGEAFLLTTRRRGMRKFEFAYDSSTREPAERSAKDWAGMQIESDAQGKRTVGPLCEFAAVPVKTLLRAWLQGVHTEGIKEIAKCTQCDELREFLTTVQKLPPLAGASGTE